MKIGKAVNDNQSPMNNVEDNDPNTYESPIQSNNQQEHHGLRELQMPFSKFKDTMIPI